jgi:starch synthase
MRVLYVSTEVYPALKTGGLADVNGALPRALIDEGCDVRLLLPAFPPLLAALRSSRPIVDLGGMFGVDVSIVGGTINDVPAYLIDVPAFYSRPGNPYVGPDGREWADNLERFALLGAVAARFADGTIDGFRPDIVHGHDWHAGLAPAYLAASAAPSSSSRPVDLMDVSARQSRDTVRINPAGEPPASVFTVHNLAFQGAFPAESFRILGLPSRFYDMEGLEFYGRVNFMKAGLYYADRITTVSPTYAREIQSPEQGCGMDGLLRVRAGAITGILNGVDPDEWNPSVDPRIEARYDRDRIGGKALCRTALRVAMQLDTAATGPVFGVISRLTTQKGLDLLLAALPRLLAGGGQLALLGSGDRDLQQGFIDAAAANPGRVSARIGYDEDLAHAIVAGADVIVVPSRFEPCGLTQMYGLAYGTLPLVCRVGGLADTVRDAADADGNGFVFEPASPEAPTRALATAIDRALDTWRDAQRWRALQWRAMADDHGWAPSAKAYVDVYRQLRPDA